jgi:hypothetical protein
MGFALWLEGDVAVAQGVHEYRPMGLATVAVTDCFRQRDFRPTPNPPARGGRNYVGLFASLVDVNHFCRGLRSQASKKNLPRVKPSLAPWL